LLIALAFPWPLGAATSGSKPLATKGLALVLGGAGPDTGTLVGFEGVLETILGDPADPADCPGTFHRSRWCLRAREEEGVGVSAAGRLVLPIGDEVLGETQRTLGHTTIVAV